MARPRRRTTLRRPTALPGASLYAPPPPGPPSGGGGGGGGGGGSSPPSSGGGSGGSSGGSSGGGGSSSGGGGKSNAQRHGEAVAKSKGSATMPGVKVFGQPISRAEYQRYKQEWNDVYRAWIGHGIGDKELKRILNRGLSAYQVRLQLVNRKSFARSPMYKTLAQQASDIVGFNYKPPRAAIRQALKSEGGLSADSYRAALANSARVRQAVTRDFNKTSGAEVEYALGAFGGTQLTQQQRQALALQQSGLRQTTQGKRLVSAFETALQRAQRAFQGQLATPTIGPQSLQAQQYQAEQEDLPA